VIGRKQLPTAPGLLSAAYRIGRRAGLRRLEDGQPSRNPFFELPDLAAAWRRGYRSTGAAAASLDRRGRVAVGPDRRAGGIDPPEAGAHARHPGGGGVPATEPPVTGPAAGGVHREPVPARPAGDGVALERGQLGVQVAHTTSLPPRA